MLGPVLYNVFLNDLFCILNDTDIACYANDSTLYSVKHLATLILLSKVQEYQPKSYLNGSSIVKWKATHISAIWY